MPAAAGFAAIRMPPEAPFLGAEDAASFMPLPEELLEDEESRIPAPAGEVLGTLRFA